LSATSAPATSATESGTVCALLLMVVSDDCLDRLQGDGDLAKDVAGRSSTRFKHLPEATSICPERRSAACDGHC
jgi:hypothetical protein